MSRPAFVALFGAALAVALAFRLASPAARPMHHDEANQAVRFGLLLEEGEYRYDRNDHHGPTLYYLTLPAAWIRGRADLASLDESTLRAVPAAFGVATIALFALMAGGMGRAAVAAAALMAAVSPALTYYSRFYIQEPLFAFFALGFVAALGRAATPPGGVLPAIWAGVAAGLLYSTKETSVIVFFGSGAALVLARMLGAGPGAAVPGRHRTGIDGASPRGVSLQLTAALAAAVSIASLAYSSFFRNPAGIVESIKAFGVYATRGLGPGPHEQPWHYYFSMLSWSQSGGLGWTEALVLGFAAFGIAAAFGRRRAGFWPRYISLYSVLTAAAFSALPYKTPWNLLPFYVGFVLMAGFGAAWLMEAPKSRAIRALLVGVLAAGCGHLALQDWRANFRYPADPRNPYAYAQTSADFLRLVDRIGDLASLHADKREMLVEVVAGPYEQWPLPWYLRVMDRVGYWTEVPEAGLPASAAIVIASQDNAEAAETSVARGYVAEHYGLRPGVLLTMYIEPALWKLFLETRTR